MAGKNLRNPVKHGKYLTYNHILTSRVKDVKSEADLRFHLIIYHEISDKGMTKGNVARYHLLAHTLEAFPELQELLDNA